MYVYEYEYGVSCIMYHVSCIKCIITMCILYHEYDISCECVWCVWVSCIMYCVWCIMYGVWCIMCSMYGVYEYHLGIMYHVSFHVYHVSCVSPSCIMYYHHVSFMYQVYQSVSPFPLQLSNHVVIVWYGWKAGCRGWSHAGGARRWHSCIQRSSQAVIGGKRWRWIMATWWVLLFKSCPYKIIKWLHISY